MFYLDGAHSPESMEVCARWFSLSIKDDSQEKILSCQPLDTSRSSYDLVQRNPDGKSRKNSTQVEHKTLDHHLADVHSIPFFARYLYPLSWAILCFIGCMMIL